MQKQNVFNPYLPLHEYIPDGEPHVFGDRVYIYGSHDREGGYTFCMEDYVVYSAPVNDLSDWRYEGVSYKASQDPEYPHMKYMYAPDVVCGNDGRYYLYYGMGNDYGQGGYHGPIRVAVSDRPEGPFEYLDVVHNPDGTPMLKYICFDPAVINDDGVIRLYYGTQYGYEEEEDFLTSGRLEDEIEMFGRTREEILSYEDSINGPSTLVLCDDMVTVKEEARHIIPYRVKGTSFEGHPFFEGPSMRKVGDKYYFVYSSWQNHELCYAVSDYPDRNFVYGGTIVSNGDVGLCGNHQMNMTGTTHGSIVEIEGQWYVFYHRLTHKSDYSRQSCAEKIYIEADGSIKQAEVTSCGLSDHYIEVKSGTTIMAPVACNITNGHMPHGSNSVYAISFPNVTNRDNDRFISEISTGTLIGYKYMDIQNVSSMQLEVRTETPDNMHVFKGPIRMDERCVVPQGKLLDNNISRDEFEVIAVPYEGHYIDVNGDDGWAFPENAISLGRIILPEDDTWNMTSASISIPDGVYALYLIYTGQHNVQLKTISFH